MWYEPPSSDIISNLFYCFKFLLLFCICFINSNLFCFTFKKAKTFHILTISLCNDLNLDQSMVNGIHPMEQSAQVNVILIKAIPLQQAVNQNVTQPHASNHQQGKA